MTDRRAPLLGRLAVHRGFLTQAQLVEALAEQERGTPRRSLGQVLIDSGALSKAQVAALVREQNQLVEKHRASAAKPRPGAAESTAPPRAGAAAPAAPRAEPKPQPPRSAAPKRPDAPQRAAAPARAAEPAARPAAPRLRGPGRLTAGGASELDGILRQAVEAGASDVHLHSGTRIRFRLRGVLEEREGPILTPERAEALLLGALSDADHWVLKERGELDFCHGIEGLGRFRANVYRQQAGLDGVFRVIPPRPPTLAELGLPDDLARLVDHHQGMVLVTGPAGCGKTSTLAALIDLINQKRPDHLLTIEDPIEYLHPSKRALVNQRSVERHTGSFARALRAALREDPDVIVIGELRDRETISHALTAAETGHFVLATLHTGSAIRTINRLVGTFPANQQPQVRSMISDSLRAVVSQRLLPRADGQGRVAAVETLWVTRAVGNLIRENKTFQIQSVLQTGAAQGMRMLDQSIRALVADGSVSREVGLRHCEDPKTLAA